MGLPFLRDARRDVRDCRAVRERPERGRSLDQSIGSSTGVVWGIDRHHFVWISADNGRTWRVSLPHRPWPERVTGSPPGPIARLAALEQVQFVDKRHGWISAVRRRTRGEHPVGQRPWAIERTVDGGRTWRISWPPGCGCATVDSQLLRRSARLRARAERLGRCNPLLFRTDDGGASWKLAGPRLGSARSVRRPSERIPHDACRDGKRPAGQSPGTVPSYRRCSTERPTAARPGRSNGCRRLRSDFPRCPSAHSVTVSWWDAGSIDTIRRSSRASTAGHTGQCPLRRLPATTVASDFTAGLSEMWAFVTPGRLYVTPRRWPQLELDRSARLARRHLPALVFSSSSVGWATVAPRPELYRTTDGGRHWSPVLLRPTKR